jgi:hypothetical protein
MLRYIMGIIDEHRQCKHDQILSIKLDSLTFDSCVNFILLKFYNTFTHTHICIAPSVFKV